jgi:hypothetical protein
MSHDTDEPNADRRFSPWKWIAWTAAIVVGVGIAMTAVDRHRMEQLRTEVESRGGHLEGARRFPTWYMWLVTKAPNGWPKATVLKLAGNFQRVVSVRLPPGTLPPHDLISRLSRFRNLSRLDLTDCHLTDADLNGLSKLSELRHLSLGSNAISDLGLADLEKLSRLQILDLRDTRAGDQFLRQVARLPQLQQLMLSHSAVTDAGLKSLATHPKLTSLWLDRTQISDAGLLALAPQPNLGALLLNDCPITDQGLAAIDEHRFPGLNYLDVSKTQVTAEGVSRLQLGNLRRLSFPDVAMTDEHWRRLAGLKTLDYVLWDDVSLRREQTFSATGRRLRLDSFRPESEFLHRRKHPALPQRFPTSSDPE